VERRPGNGNLELKCQFIPATARGSAIEHSITTEHHVSWIALSVLDSVTVYYIACANQGLGIEFCDRAPLAQVVFSVCLRSLEMNDEERRLGLKRASWLHPQLERRVLLMVHLTDREWARPAAIVRAPTSIVDAKKREESYGYLA
jgi:hypothetical protein